jgi:hypothetical protein
MRAKYLLPGYDLHQQTIRCDGKINSNPTMKEMTRMLGNGIMADLTDSAMLTKIMAMAVSPAFFDHS